MSRFEDDNLAISMIQFQSDWPRKVKNRMIQEIEDRQHQEEQKNINGEDTGYYE